MSRDGSRGTDRRTDRRGTIEAVAPVDAGRFGGTDASSPATWGSAEVPDEVIARVG